MKDIHNKYYWVIMGSYCGKINIGHYPKIGARNQYTSAAKAPYYTNYFWYKP